MTSPEPDAPPTLAKLEAEQERQSGLIDEILGILKGGRAPEGDPPVTRADPPAPDIGAQMEEAIRKVNAERDTEAAAKSKPEPEKPPVEAGQPMRARLANALYGKEPRK